MKGKIQFTNEEIERLFELVKQKNVASRDEQKSIRNRIRKIGFYYSDFSNEKKNYTIQDIQKLIESGSIIVLNHGRGITPKESVKPIVEVKALVDNAKHSFSYVYNDGATILILGTFPGEESLGRVEYYANSRNAFWRILCNVYGVNLDFQTYDDKLDFLANSKIALWDIYQKVDRVGSLDIDIKAGSVNDINRFLQERPTIQKVVFNGKEASRVYERHFNKLERVEYIVLPSTSATHTITIEEKTKAWKTALKG